MKYSLSNILLLFFICPFFTFGQLVTTNDAYFELLSSVWFEGGFAIDHDGNTYTSTIGGSQVSFSNSPLVGSGDASIFKHDTQGNLDWIVSGGSNASIDDIKIGPTNNIFICGYSDYGLFPNSFDSTNAYGFSDYIAKMSTDGTFEWVFKTPGNAKITPLPNGNVAFVLSKNPTNNSLPFLGDSLYTSLSDGIIIYGEINENGSLVWSENTSQVMSKVNMASKTVHGLKYNDGKLYMYGYYSGTFLFGQQSLTLDVTCGWSSKEKEMYLATIDIATRQFSSAVKTKGLKILDLDFDDQNNIFYMMEFTKNCNSASPVTEFIGHQFSEPPKPNLYLIKSDENFNFIDWHDLGGTSTSNSAKLRGGDLMVSGEKVFTYFYSEQYGEVFIPDSSNTFNYGIDRNAYLIAYDLDLNYKYHDYFRADGYGYGYGEQFFKLDVKGDKAAFVAYRHQTIIPYAFTIRRFKPNVNMISGKAYKDFNQNQVFDSTDQLVTGNGIQITPNPYMIVTHLDGTFDAFVDVGTYHLNIANVPNYLTENPSPTTVVFSTLDSTANIDLRLTPVPGGHDVSIDIVPVDQMIVGNNVTHKLIVTNNGTFQENINVFFSPLTYSLPFSNVNIIPSMSVTGNTFTTTLFNMNPGESRVFIIEYDVPIEFLNILGEISNCSAEASIIHTDEVLSDNYVVLSDSPKAAYDPNIKIVNEPSKINIEYIDEIEWINYTVYFQNEGNAPAINVRIEDVIDTNLVLSTIKIIDASDDVYITVNDRKVIFHFDSIMLPNKSFDESGSKGYVSFKFNRIQSLTLGDSIQNSADIYFDFNPEITTNTTLNEVVSYLSYTTFKNVATDYVIYPNPASSFLTIQNLPEINLEIKISDAEGRVHLIQNSRKNKEFTLDISNLDSGAYFINVGQSIRKIIIN